MLQLSQNTTQLKGNSPKTQTMGEEKTLQNLSLHSISLIIDFIVILIHIKYNLRWYSCWQLKSRALRFQNWPKQALGRRQLLADNFSPIVP